MLGRNKIRRNKARIRRQAVSRKGSGLGIGRFLFGGVGILALSLVFVFGHDFLTQETMFSAKVVTVAGNKVLSESQILTLAGIKSGDNIFSVNLNLIRKQLLSSPWIAEAKVGRQIPDGLAIRVREHEPAALLDLGKIYIMSREGTIIKEWEETDPRLPLVTGLSYADLPLGEAPGKAFGALLSVLDIARKDTGPLAVSRIETIHVDQDLGITLFATGGIRSAWIGYQNFSEKYERLQRLLAHLGERPGQESLTIFDLESDARVVAGPFPEAADNTTRRS